MSNKTETTKEIIQEVKEVDLIPTYNIYTKLQKLRKDFHKVELKKSGENKFAGFKYFELKDILPTAVELLEKYNLTTIMTTNTEGASLILINCDKPEETITFFIPDAQCQLKGCTDIQSLGGKITYQKRYLYVNLLDVCENDTLDAVVGSENASKGANNTNTQQNNYRLSEKQINRLFVLAKNANISEEQAKAQIKMKFNKTVEQLSKDEYDKVCNGYQSIANK